MKSRLAFCGACLSAVAGLFGCNPPDPTWELPCEERPAREVVVGTGEEGSFETADDRDLEVVYGSQGGTHIWLGVRVRGFGPNASVTYGIDSATDPTIVWSGQSSEYVKFQYNPGEEASEVSGLFAILNPYDTDDEFAALPDISGEQVVLWADVVDDCTPTAVHGETVSQVR